MALLDELRSRNPSLFQPAPVAAEAGSSPPAGIPPGMVQIVNTVENIMPTVEKITGLSRRDIFMALLKTGLKGGGIDTILNSLMGKQEKEAKFVRYVKTLAIWVPVGMLLLGLSIVAIVFFVKFLIIILGIF